LLTCTYGRESPVLLTARAVLYEWLVSKFGEKVTVEKKVDETYFSRPVDCWVEKDNEALAYWILETAAPPQTRDALRDGFRRLAAVVHGVFLAQMLHEDEEMPNWVQLTTTEREFMRHTVYDDIVSQGVPGGQSLHYLDAETRTLTTFRGLQLVHAPTSLPGRKSGTPYRPCKCPLKLGNSCIPENMSAGRDTNRSRPTSPTAAGRWKQPAPAGANPSARLQERDNKVRWQGPRSLRPMSRLRQPRQ
jgi:hypothetical protein